MDNSEQSSINSDVYQWDSGSRRFSAVPVQYLATRGAMASEIVRVGQSVYLVIANNMDSATQNYELK